MSETLVTREFASSKREGISDGTPAYDNAALSAEYFAGRGVQLHPHDTMVLSSSPRTDELTNQIRTALANHGIFLGRASDFFTEEQSGVLSSAMRPELVTPRTQGDLGERTNLNIGRWEILRDTEYPHGPFTPLGRDILRTLQESSLLPIASTLVGMPLEPCAVFLNAAGPGGFVGRHTDSDSNQNILLFSVVYPLGSQFTGGELLVYGPHGPVKCRVREGDLVLGWANYPHEGLPVLSGARWSIPFFLSLRDHPELELNRIDHIRALKRVAELELYAVSNRLMELCRIEERISAKKSTG